MQSTELLHPNTTDGKTRPLLSPAGRIKSFVVMILLLVLGLLTAICHHALYSHLDGQQPDRYFVPQIWVIRIGIALAFLFKLSLVAAVGNAYIQQSWYSFQRSAITVDGIDAVFGILQDPRKFLVAEMVLKTQVLAFMALVSWLVPLSAIFSTASLTVVQSPIVSNIDNLVPVLGPLNGSAGLYELVSNTPPTFGGPTPQLTRLALRVFTAGDIVYLPSPCGINCTYTTVFDGPAFNCVDYYDPNLLVGDRRALFSAGPTPEMVPPPAGTNLTNYHPASDGMWLNRTIYQNGTMLSTHCMLHYATYTTTVQYINNVPNFTTTVELHQQIYSSVFNDLVQINQGQLPMDNHTASFTNFYAIEQAVENLFDGGLEISPNGGNGLIGNPASQVQLWNLVTYQPGELLFPTNFSQQVEQLLINATLSLMYFAHDPLPAQDSILAGNVDAVLEQPTNTTVLSYPALYHYSPRTLWEVYGIALGVSTMCVILGCIMLFKNRMDSEMSFSRVLVTTRNPSLDQLCQATSKEIRKTKLRYGELIGEQHACFGLDHEIRKI